MLPEWTGPDGRGWDASLQKKNLRTKLPRTTLGTGLGTGLARTDKVSEKKVKSARGRYRQQQPARDAAASPRFYLLVEAAVPW